MHKSVEANREGLTPTGEAHEVATQDTNDVMIFDASKGVSAFKRHITASFAVHPNFRSHPGRSGKFGGRKGHPINMSAKQKLNTDSSIIAELVATGQSLPFFTWTLLLLVEQGCPTETNWISQDENNATSSKKNRKAKISKQTMTIYMQHFVVTNCIKKSNLEIAHCPTVETMGNCFMKTVKHTKFSKFQKTIEGQD